MARHGRSPYEKMDKGLKDVTGKQNALVFVAYTLHIKKTDYLAISRHRRDIYTAQVPPYPICTFSPSTMTGTLRTPLEILSISSILLLSSFTSK